MAKSQELYKQAKTLIPGGTQLLSKRPEMFLPEQWPAYYAKAKGCEVWDLDGKKYIDMSNMGVGSCLLGYADDDVNKAVKSAVDKGSMCTLNAPEEVELGRVLLSLHPWASMVRYARSGGESMAIAVRIARAASGKDGILFCGYHGWHDWYLSANLASDKALDGHLLPGLDPQGVPRSLRGTARPFRYNDVGGFLALIKKHRQTTGVIIMEPIRSEQPSHEFIDAVQRAAKAIKAVLIVDEITAGFRLTLGGAHLLSGLVPDIAVFAKGMSNGFPMAAIIGKQKVMTVAQNTFISSTYWTDRIGPTAALATIKKLKKCEGIAKINKIGREIKRGWASLAQKHRIAIKVSGIDPLGHFVFQYPDAAVLKTFFTQSMLERGFLATNAFYASAAHDVRHVEGYLAEVDAVFGQMAMALRRGSLKKFLKGPVCHSGFKRLA